MESLYTGIQIYILIYPMQVIYIVCAVSDKAVGVDIERQRKNVIRVAKRFFTQAECDWIGNDSLKFSRIWTLKEAYAKLTGEGIAGTVSKAEFRHEADNGINDAVVADNAICSDNIEKSENVYIW